MLNEILEYRQYRCPDKYGNRLKYHSLQNGLSGLNRAMEIIAAYEISWRIKEYGNLDAARDLSYLKTILIHWYEKEFVSYCRSISRDRPPTAFGGTKPRLYADALSKEKEIRYSLIFAPGGEGSDRLSTYNQVTAERAIANALEKKKCRPLVRYYLTADTDMFTKDNVSVSNKSHAKTNAGKTAMDFLQKMTAAYLLKQKEMPADVKCIPINQADVFNWTVKGQYDQYFNKTTYFLEPEHLPIFEKTEATNRLNSLVKYSVLPDWIRHFSLIEESGLDAWLEANKSNPDKHFYSDLGPAEMLRVDERYDLEDEMFRDSDEYDFAEEMLRGSKEYDLAEEMLRDIEEYDLAEEMLRGSEEYDLAEEMPSLDEHY